MGKDNSRFNGSAMKVENLNPTELKSLLRGIDEELLRQIATMARTMDKIKKLQDKKDRAKERLTEFGF